MFQSLQDNPLQQVCLDISRAHMVVACISKDYAVDAMSMSHAEYNFIRAQRKSMVLARLSADVDFSHADYVSCRRKEKGKNSCRNSCTVQLL
jgi:hypothetical protein